MQGLGRIESLGDRARLRQENTALRAEVARLKGALAVRETKIKVLRAELESNKGDDHGRS
jgi:hypothetical protein